MATVSSTVTLRTLSVSESEPAVLYESGSAGPTDTIDLTGLRVEYAHWFCSVQMFDGNGDQVSADAGTFALKVGTLVNGVLEDPPVASIDATAPVTLDWAGNTERVQVVPTGLSGVTTWRVRLVANRS